MFSVFQVRVILLFVYVFNISNGKFRYRITKFNCATSNKTLYSNVSCQYKTYKTGSLASFRATILRISENVQLTCVLKRQNSDGYRTVLNIKNIEICKIIKNLENAPIPFIDTFLNFLKSGKAFGSSNVMEFCDLKKGDIYFLNGTLDKFGTMEIFPEGFYVFNIQVFDYLDPDILNMTFVTRLVKFS